MYSAFNSLLSAQAPVPQPSPQNVPVHQLAQPQPQPQAVQPQLQPQTPTLIQPQQIVQPQPQQLVQPQPQQLVQPQLQVSPVPQQPSSDPSLVVPVQIAAAPSIPPMSSMSAVPSMTPLVHQPFVMMPQPQYTIPQYNIPQDVINGLKYEMVMLVRAEVATFFEAERAKQEKIVSDLREIMNNLVVTVADQRMSVVREEVSRLSERVHQLTTDLTEVRSNVVSLQTSRMSMSKIGISSDEDEKYFETSASGGANNNSSVRVFTGQVLDDELAEWAEATEQSNRLSAADETSANKRRTKRNDSSTEDKANQMTNRKSSSNTGHASPNLSRWTPSYDVNNNANNNLTTSNTTSPLPTNNINTATSPSNNNNNNTVSNNNNNSTNSSSNSSSGVRQFTPKAQTRGSSSNSVVTLNDALTQHTTLKPRSTTAPLTGLVSNPSGSFKGSFAELMQMGIIAETKLPSDIRQTVTITFSALGQEDPSGELVAVEVQSNGFVKLEHGAFSIRVLLNYYEAQFHVPNIRLISFSTEYLLQLLRSYCIPKTHSEVA
eukprot:c14505_g1_i3.p1 GENE.c14505_g1_i3~~c14505_g1_i3.p1  ORF type:complete len:546 (+),score=139.04 c14505_g1_i3:1-1638(+)